MGRSRDGALHPWRRCAGPRPQPCAIIRVEGSNPARFAEPLHEIDETVAPFIAQNGERDAAGVERIDRAQWASEVVILEELTHRRFASPIAEGALTPGIGIDDIEPGPSVLHPRN